jgi:hypothetical protein
MRQKHIKWFIDNTGELVICQRQQDVAVDR